MVAKHVSNFDNQIARYLHQFFRKELTRMRETKLAASGFLGIQEMLCDVYQKTSIPVPIKCTLKTLFLCLTSSRRNHSRGRSQKYQIERNGHKTACKKINANIQQLARY
jgi:hypothetical protein